jgi:hypothetical protein
VLCALCELYAVSLSKMCAHALVKTFGCRDIVGLKCETLCIALGFGVAMA